MASSEHAQILASAATGFKYLMGLQVFSRVITFVMNVVIARLLGPSIYGLSQIHFQLLISCIIQTTREGVRRTCQRFPLSSDQNPTERVRTAGSLVNIAWATVPLSAAVSLLWCTIYLFSNEYSAMPGYAAAVALFGIGCVVETASEAGYVIAQAYRMYGVRVAVEAAALLVRSILTCILLAARANSLVLLGLGQVVYAAMLCIGYYGFFAWRRLYRGSDVPSLRPRPLVTAAPCSQGLVRVTAWVEWPVARLAAIFSWQSLHKFALTEGEKIALAAGQSAVHQGEFALVSNLGSLVVRFVLQPLEEALALTMAHLYRSSTAEAEHGRSFGGFAAMRRLTAVSVKLVLLIGLMSVATGPHLCDAAIYVLYGAKWTGTDAPRLLKYYCVLLLFLGVNGVTEAVMNAVADESELRRATNVFMPVSVVYVLASMWSAHRFGPAALILANCVNMGIRIVYSTVFIIAFFKKGGCGHDDDGDGGAGKGGTWHWTAVLPSKVVIGSLILGSAVLYTSSWAYGGCCSWRFISLHVAVSMASLASIAVAVLAGERDFIREVRTLSAVRKSSRGKGD